MSLKFGNRYQAAVAKPKIIAFGVGGGGCNAINSMIAEGIEGVDFIIANTDAQALQSSSCENKVQLGATITNGLGAGSVPDIGRRAAEESASEIEDYMRDAHMVFVACGMGGGTGTGAAPVVAKIAKERGLLTIGVVTKPFDFEQKKRMQVAEEGISNMRKYCDTTIVIANQNLFRIATEDTSLKEAFKMADNVLVSGIRCITDLITHSGMVNLDFADVSAIMSDMECAVMGEGEGEGEERDIKAVENAMTNPLLEESSIKGATGVLVNICSGSDFTLYEMNRIMARVEAEVGIPGCNLKFGSIFKDNMGGKIKVSLVATHSKAMRSTKKTEEVVQKNSMDYSSILADDIDDTVKSEIPSNEHDIPLKNDFYTQNFEENEIEDEETFDDSNKIGYLKREHFESDDDYFKSFYSGKKTGEDSVGSLNEFLENPENDASKPFVPKKVINIEEAVNKNLASEKNEKPKFDFKSIFRINKGA